MINTKPNEYIFHRQINENVKQKLIDITKIISESLESNDYMNLRNFNENFSKGTPGGPRIETIKFAYEKDGIKFHIQVSRIAE